MASENRSLVRYLHLIHRKRLWVIYYLFYMVHQRFRSFFIQKLNIPPALKRKSSAPLQASPAKDTSRYVAFSLSFIALAVKLAQSDSNGTLNEKEYEAIIALLPVDTKDDVQSVRRLLSSAKEDPLNADHYLKMVKRLFPTQRQLHQELLGHLLHVALSDAPLHPKEMHILHQIQQHLEIPSSVIYDLLRKHVLPKSEDPYKWFGITRQASAKELQQAYYHVVRDCHPDTLHHTNVAKEYRLVMEEKLSAANDAYDTLRKKHRKR